MKGREVILGQVDGRDAAALIVDGELDDLLVDGDAPRPGTIYRAKATRPVKGQGGMFFDTPDGSGFLRGAKGFAPGDFLLVQVSGYADEGKAIPLTAKLLFKSRYAIVTPDAPGMNISRSIKDEEERLNIRAAAETELAEASGFGVILRSACSGADPDDIAEDVDAMVELAQAVLNDDGAGIEKLSEGTGPQELAWRDWQCDTVREGDLSEWLAQARKTDIRLSGGASMAVEPTRAFIAVDVNTGGDTSPAAGQKANIAAARALPRALRVRGLGGQVVVDFAPMPKKDRKGLESVLRAALRGDDVETALVGWTQMGHFELNRKRARLPLNL
ncbi:ribonuclease G [Aliishimia ponticola]|uniref:Ribonuclease G n=1 Tax=Aliishimia ponticola TaxID=2499833 RepID=A0A4S4NDL5_9RHOB|nr:ribonuclease E/G [Aliishimia ponticola]THH36148.1 ribonuclease G [Aliishimia ponticola]